MYRNWGAGHGTASNSESDLVADVRRLEFFSPGRSNDFARSVGSPNRLRGLR